MNISLFTDKRAIKSTSFLRTNNYSTVRYNNVVNQDVITFTSNNKPKENRYNKPALIEARVRARYLRKAGYLTDINPNEITPSSIIKAKRDIIFKVLKEELFVDIDKTPTCPVVKEGKNLVQFFSDSAVISNRDAIVPTISKIVQTAFAARELGKDFGEITSRNLEAAERKIFDDHHGGHEGQKAADAYVESYKAKADEICRRIYSNFVGFSDAFMKEDGGILFKHEIELHEGFIKTAISIAQDVHQ